MLTTRTPPSAIAQARAIIQAEIAGKVPGLSVAVAVAGKLVWSEGFGYADLAAKRPVTSDTRFRIGSVSKPLTAAGLALLVENGLLDLDAPIQRYIPDFPQKEAPLTARLLAGHLSGIRNFRGREAASNRPFLNLREGLKIFENDPLESVPGSKFSYASYNWNLLGVVMEAASRQDFLQYMDRAVIQPLGLLNTVPDRAGVADPQRTKFYETMVTGGFVIAPEVNLSYAWPAGGYLSTAEDLVRFGSAMLQPGFLKPESRRLLFLSQKTSGGKLTNYGVGWFVSKIAYHGGDSIGGNAILLLEPAAQTVVAILSNRGHLAFAKENGRLKYVALPGHLMFQREKIALQIARLFGQATEDAKTMPAGEPL